MLVSFPLFHPLYFTDKRIVPSAFALWSPGRWAYESAFVEVQLLRQRVQELEDDKRRLQMQARRGRDLNG